MNLLSDLPRLENWERHYIAALFNTQPHLVGLLNKKEVLARLVPTGNCSCETCAVYYKLGGSDGNPDNPSTIRNTT